MGIQIKGRYVMMKRSVGLWYGIIRKGVGLMIVCITCRLQLDLGFKNT